MKNHPTGITIADRHVWSAHAAEIGKLHAIPVNDIDKGGSHIPFEITEVNIFLERYTTMEFAEDTGPGGANTRQIIHHFDSIEEKTCGEKMTDFLTHMNWTYSEYEELEKPILWPFL